MKRLARYLTIVICITCIGMIFNGCGSADTQTEEVIEEQAQESDKEIKEETVTPAVTPEPTPIKEEVKEVTASGADVTEAPEPTPEVDEFGLASDIDSSKIVNFEEAKTLFAQTNVNMRTGPSTDYE
ncbi:MAG: hypothetical protein J6W58_05520, partial [Lachnospiraceae bacterium]|nr:hypothetical protein [Lachnospiraceae bacterium]